MALTPVQEGAASTPPAHHPTMLSEAGNGISSPMPDPRADAEARAGLLGRIAAMLVAISLRRPILTLAISALFGIAACWVLATRFALDTDTMRMFPEDLPWRRTEKAINAAFPQRADVIMVVVDGATPDVAEHAAVALAEELQRASRGLRSVTRPDAEVFFRRNALLFPKESVVRTTTEQIISAQPMLGTLAADPSLRGSHGRWCLLQRA